MRLYNPPTLTRHPSPVTTTLQNSSSNTLKINIPLPRTSINNTASYRQYINQTTLIKPIRGRDLFVRSIRRILEQIRDRKQQNKNNPQIFSTLEETIGIFNDLTFIKCMLLKKRLLDPNYRPWTVEFAREGGLHALLAYLEQVTSKGLSLVDAILVNETLQCLRAMMNITELFEHIAANPQYIDSIAKVLRVPSDEIRMRVFELFTALCVYSSDGYEIVLRALHDFQENNKLSNVFVIILEQIKSSVHTKYKWSAIALLNSIISSTGSIEKRLTYRNTLYSNGLLSTLDQARSDADADLNFQIDIFYEDQKRDEEEFLGHFDQNDNQAVCQAIQLQLPPSSNESALFLTAMQLLYTDLASTKNSTERETILQGLLQFVSHATEKNLGKKTAEKAAQTHPNSLVIPQPILNMPTTTTTIPSPHQSNNPQVVPNLINTRAPIDIPPPSPQPTDLQITPADLATAPSALPPPPPPPPFPVDLQINSSTVPPPPPPPPPMPGGFLGPPPPPPMPGGPGGPPPLPAPGQFVMKQSIVGLSAVVDSIPKPKGSLRRLQWKKLPQTILTTSQFWTDVNKNSDSRINFAQLEDSFKINTEYANTTLPAKAKATAILPCNRSIAINVFLKKFNFTDAQSLVQCLGDIKSNLNAECLRMLLKILPTADEIQLVRDHPHEQWTLPEVFIHEIASVSLYEFRVRSRILMIEFTEMFDEFQEKFHKILRIINFLQSNSSIKHLARSLLSIGDFLNYGSYAGNAFGFRLDILNQLNDIRSSESKTLLCLLVENSDENFKFITELKPMFVDDIQLKSTKNEYTDWKKRIDDGRKHIDTITDEQFVEQYKSFYQTSSSNLATNLDPLANQCDQQEKELMKQFGETDVSEFSYDTCCAIFRQLIDQVGKENKEREKRLTMNKVLLNKPKLITQKSNLINEHPKQQLGENNLMDSLMTDLKNNRKFATVPAKRIRLRPCLFE